MRHCAFVVRAEGGEDSILSIQRKKKRMKKRAGGGGGQTQNIDV
jgi:hypothetical protein